MLMCGMTYTRQNSVWCSSREHVWLERSDGAWNTRGKPGTFIRGQEWPHAPPRWQRHRHRHGRMHALPSVLAPLADSHFAKSQQSVHARGPAGRPAMLGGHHACPHVCSPGVTWQRSRAEASCLSAPRPEDPTAATGLARRAPTPPPRSALQVCVLRSSSNHPSIRLESMSIPPISPSVRPSTGHGRRGGLPAGPAGCGWPCAHALHAPSSPSLFQMRWDQAGRALGSSLTPSVTARKTRVAAAAPEIEGGFRFYRDLFRLPGSDLLRPKQEI
jgi:hypothetical protein